jgi:hypothetical protein
VATLTTEELEMRRSTLQEQLVQVGELRLGSLIHRYRRCGKPNCVCAEPGHRGHGCWVITKRVSGKNVMSTVPDEEDLPEVRRQLEEGRRFWKLAEEFAEASDELSRRRLKETGADAPAKKRGSKRSSRPRSSGRSKD